MNVAVFFGGRSSEHDISIITAMQAIAKLDKKHRCIPVYITDKGVWLCGKGFDRADTFSRPVRGKRVHLRPSSDALYQDSGKRLCRIDAALICMHGMGGEDGTVAGVLELSGIPYTGSGLRASAVGMDKITLKHLLTGCGVPVVKYVGIDKYGYRDNLFAITERIKNELRFPLIVKPSNLGSSIGISLADNFSELFTAISIAFEWDTRVIIEEALTDFTELNCAVLGYGDRFEASEIEQPVGWEKFLTYEDKYEGGFKGLSERKFPAPLSAELRNKVRGLALETFRAIDAAGVARVDFLLKDDELYVNEINTVPGSLSNYLFPEPDKGFTALIERLLEIAVDARKDKDSLNYAFKRTRLIGGGIKK